MTTMKNPRDEQHKSYEVAARKIWGHDPDPESAGEPIVPQVTIIADAANAPDQSDSHGSAGAIDNTVPTTSTAPTVKDGKVQPAAAKAAMPMIDIAAGKSPVTEEDDGNGEQTPESAYRKAWMTPTK